MDKRKLNNETGITIIALSITIIVMLILAGISIATVSPMIKNSEEAKQEQDIETEKSIVSRAAFAAEKVGVKRGDILLEIDGIELEKMSELRTYIYGKNVGEIVNIKLIRSNKEYQISVTLAKK